jgi:hypothetical protein
VRVLRGGESSAVLEGHTFPSGAGRTVDRTEVARPSAPPSRRPAPPLRPHSHYLGQRLRIARADRRPLEAPVSK